MLNRISAGRTDLVLDFVESGNSVTSLDAKGNSLLSLCAYYGDVSALRFLISRGEILGHLGSDLGLNAAAFHGHWQLCQFLLEQSAQVNAGLPGTGETPLHAAICSVDRVRYDEVVKVLLATGANPNAATIPGIETGAFMRDCRTKGETPLHRAAAFGGIETIQMLLDSGANPELQDASGDTPLSWASWHRRPISILRLLCYKSFQIHPDYQTMQANLIGKPFPDTAT